MRVWSLNFLQFWSQMQFMVRTGSNCFPIYYSFWIVWNIPRIIHLLRLKYGKQRSSGYFSVYFVLYDHYNFNFFKLNVYFHNRWYDWLTYHMYKHSLSRFLSFIYIVLMHVFQTKSFLINFTFIWRQCIAITLYCYMLIY